MSRREFMASCVLNRHNNNRHIGVLFQLFNLNTVQTEAQRHAQIRYLQILIGFHSAIFVHSVWLYQQSIGERITKNEFDMIKAV